MKLQHQQQQQPQQKQKQQQPHTQRGLPNTTIVAFELYFYTHYCYNAKMLTAFEVM